MSFNYNLNTDIGLFRFYVNDTIRDKGPYPDKKNFQDEEIAVLLSVAQDDLNSAVVSGLKLLAIAWGSYAVEEKDKEFSFRAEKVAETYANRARELEKNPIDETISSQYLGTVTLQRVDQWSS